MGGSVGDRLAVYADSELGRYGYEEKPWFRPTVRLDAFLTELDARSLLDSVALHSAPPATRQELQLFHGGDYIDWVRARCARNEGALDHGPTFARSHIERAAAHVVGAALHATRRILDGTHGTAFIPISGFHHAFADEARLYCLYNDPAVVLSWLLDELDGNLAYIDIDIHQGDGVYQAFAGEPRVCIADLHEDPSTLFPHAPDRPGQGDFAGRRAACGTGAGFGTKLNIPLDPFTDDARYLALWEEAEAFVRAAAPRFIVFVSGVDGLQGDPLSHQSLSLDTIREVTRRVRALADETAEGRLLVLGGGGYDLTNVARGWTTVVETLLER